jgi:hypothetical protein
VSVEFALQDVSAWLTEPAKGDFSLKHNETFDKWNGIFGDTVHTINKFIGYLNDVGADIPKIPWDDLYQELVVPLAGDYSLIAQNGDACTKTKDAMHAWAGNVDRINMGRPTCWKGKAAEGFGGQMLAYTLVLDGVGEVMGIGTSIFNGLSLVSQRLGVCVENAIVKAAQLIEKVAKKVLSKVSGLFGWLSLGYTLAKDGFEYFRDLIDDVENAKRLIQDCFDLKDQVIAWAKAEEDRLKAFLKIPDIISKLPHVTPHDLATSTVDPQLKQDLKDLKDAINGDTAAAARQELQSTIDDIEAINVGGD